MAKNKNYKKKEAKSSSAAFTFWMIGLVAVCILAFIFLGNHSKEKEANKTTETAVKIDYSKQPFQGDASAPVSIIEFGDYKCPICKDFNKNSIPTIEKQLVDSGKAKLYFMNYSFIYDDSIRSAKFAESVFQELGNDTFWKFHERLYEKQPDSKYEKTDVYSEKFLTDTLKEVASAEDVNKVVKNFDAHKSDDAWKKDMDLAGKLGVTGTPTLFVNGKQFTGSTMDDLTNMVETASKEK